MNAVDNYFKAYSDLWEYFGISGIASFEIEDNRVLYWSEFQGQLFLGASEFNLAAFPPTKIKIDEVYRKDDFTCMLIAKDEIFEPYYIILDNNKEIK